MNIYANDLETLEFPCEFKKKLKMKASLGNLSISFTPGHLIKINNTNLSITEPYKIIAKNNSNTLIAYFYEDNNKIYLPISNAIISFTKFIDILNKMNKNQAKMRRKIISYFNSKTTI